MKRISTILMVVCCVANLFASGLTVKVRTGSGETTLNNVYALADICNGQSSSFAVSDIKGLTISAGSFEQSDWQWIKNQENLELEDFTITSGVTSVSNKIPERCFYYSASTLTKVSVAKLDSLPNEAFYTTTSPVIESVDFPDAVFVGADQFQYATKLTSAHLPKADTIANFAFYKTENLVAISLPEVRGIGAQAFQYGGLVKISMPKIQYVDQSAFLYTSTFRNVEIGADLKTQIGYSNNVKHYAHLVAADGTPLTGSDFTAAKTAISSVLGNWIVDDIYEVKTPATEGVIYAPNTFFAQAGDEVVLKAVPVKNYFIQQLKYTPDGEAAVNITSGTTIVMPAKDITLSAAAAVNSLTISLNGNTPAEYSSFEAAYAANGFVFTDVHTVDITAGQAITDNDWDWWFTQNKKYTARSDNYQNHFIVRGVGQVADFKSKTSSSDCYFYSVDTLIIEGMKTLGAYTLWSCGLDYLSLPDVETIETNAVCQNSVKDFYLPKVTSIGSYALGYAHITTLNLPKVTTVSSYVFNYSPYLKIVSMPQATSLSTGIFYGCNALTNLELGATPPSVYNNTFTNMPEDRYLRLVAADGTPLTGGALSSAIASYLAVNDGNTSDNLWYGWKLQGIHAISIDDNEVTFNLSHAFSAQGTAIEYSYVPASGKYATNVYYTIDGGDGTHYAVSDGSFTMPDADITIHATIVDNNLIVKLNGESPLSGPSLSSIIANSGKTLFEIKSIEIIGGYAFTADDWNWLASVRSTGSDYYNYLCVEDFTITDAIGEVADAPDGFMLTTRSDYGIRHISIAKLKHVGKDFLNGGSGLLSVDMPDLVSAGQSAFSRTSSLTSITLPKLESISSQMFFYQSGLTTASFPEATSVENYAFYTADKLRNISLPKVTSIENDAFENSTILTSMQLGATPPTVESKAFDGCPSPRFLQLVAADGTPLTGEALTSALAAYRAVNDGNTSDDLWYGWSLAPTHTITCSEFEHGSVVAKYDIASAGTEITISTSVDKGYYAALEYITKADGVHHAIEGGEFVMPDDDVTITAEVKRNNLSLRIVKTDNSVLEISVPMFDSLQLYLSSYRDIKELYVTDGDYISANDWTYLFNYSRSYPLYYPYNMERFEVSNSVKMVDDFPSTTSKFYFAAGKLRFVTIPRMKNLTKMFQESYITNINMPDATCIQNSALRDMYSDSLVLNLPKVKEIQSDAFYNSKKLVSLSLPQLEVVYGSSTFGYCSNFRYFELGASAPSVPVSYLFDYCPSKRALRLVDPEGTPLAGDALTSAIASYKACNDGNVNDDLWYGWRLGENHDFKTIVHGHGSIVVDANGFLVGYVGDEISFTATSDNAEVYPLDSVVVYRAGNRGERITFVDNKFTMPAYDVVIEAYFGLKTYAITNAVVANGSTATTPATAQAADSLVTIVATPIDETYILSSVSVYETATPANKISVDGNNQFVMPAAAVTVEASFILKKVTSLVTVNAMAHGTVSTSPAGSATEDVEVLLTITPDQGYEFVQGSLKVYKSDDESTEVTINDNKFVMPAYDVTVAAEFRLITYTISEGEHVNGSLSWSGTAAPDSTITIVAEPNAGYSFRAIEVRKTADNSLVATLENDTRTFTMPAYDVTIKAIYNAITYNITKSATLCDLTISPEGNQIIGTEMSITVTPNANCHLQSLKVFKTGDESTEVTVVDNKFAMPDYDVTVKAVCVIDVFSITPETPEHGSFTLSKTSGIEYNQNVIITATPATGYEVDKYIVDGVEQDVNSFLMPAKDIAVNVTFRLKDFDITKVSVANGEIEIDKNVAKMGEVVTITALTPNEGYSLVANSLLVYNTDNSTEKVEVVDNKFVMPAFNVTITAQFTANSYAISTVVEHGRIEVKSSALFDEQVSFEVIPDDGYELIYGSLKIFKTDAESTIVSQYSYTFDMPAYDVTITAEFKPTSTVGVETPEMVEIYAREGRIYCEGDFRIYDVVGRDVTRMNGQLEGVYIVRCGEQSTKIVVR